MGRPVFCMNKFLIACFLFAGALAAPGFTKKGATLRSSGTQSDVQAAIDAASEGATVTIPSGTFDWSGQLMIKKAISLAGNDTTIRNQNGSSSMILALSGKSGNIEIYGISFVQVADNSGGKGFCIEARRDESTSYTVKIHDCHFDEAGVYNYSMREASNGILVWNCSFIGAGIGGINFVVDEFNYESYNQPSTLGTRDSTGLKNSYVEDCSFTNASTGMVNFDANSRVVLRHCTAQDAAVGSHGQETSPIGVTSWEVYDNTWKISKDNPANMNNWLHIRGGTGVVTRNNFEEIPWGKSQIVLTVFSVTRGANDGHGSSFCPIEYPAPRQTGWSWADNGANWGKVEDEQNPQLLEGGRSPGYFLPNGKGAQVDPVYIWDNTGPGATSASFLWIQTYEPDNCGNQQNVANTYLRANRDYFVNAGPKPGWTPYPYPHPLRTGGAPSPTPTPPEPTPSATPPQPTPTPQPSATPPGSHRYQILMESDSPMYVTPQK